MRLVLKGPDHLRKSREVRGPLPSLPRRDPPDSHLWSGSSSGSQKIHFLPHQIENKCSVWRRRNRTKASIKYSPPVLFGRRSSNCNHVSPDSDGCRGRPVPFLLLSALEPLGSTEGRPPEL